MHKFALILAASLALTVHADNTVCDMLGDTNVVFTTLMADGSTNTWTQSDLVQALGLLNRKYHREIAAPAGRKEWHGRLVKEIIDEDAETKTEIHEDGTTFVYRFKVVTPSQAVTDSNEKLVANTNGVPAALAAARLRRVQEIQTTNVVNQVITSGGVE